MHRSLLTIFLLVFTITPVMAQEPSPGDACDAGRTDHIRQVGGPETSGVVHLMRCDGANWQQYMTILADGKVGIGTGAPEARLDVAGEIKISKSGLTCGAAQEGAIRYNDATPCMEYCDSAAWQCISPQPCSDMTPDSFNFTDQASVTASTLIESDIVQITGITCQVNVSISGEGSPQYRTCSDGSSVANCDGSVIQDWTDAASGINNNEYVQARLTSSAAGGDTFTAHVFAGNTVDSWNVTPDGDCTDPSPAPGTVCADGTIYAGQSPDGNVKMFTSRCDEGQSWSGAECTGSRVNLSWNNGNSSDYVTTGATSTVTGEDNTNTLDGLDSDSGTAGNQPHQAAQRCADLSLNGHTDWYLPAEQELDVLYQNNGVIGNFNTGGSFYWSSSESINDNARNQRFSDGNLFSYGKSTTRLLRCVRR